MQYTAFIISALAGFAAAATPADTTKPPSGNAITSPLNEIVPEGKPFTIKWTPDTPGKVSIWLLKGPSSNVVPISVIADSIDNSGSFVWTPAAGLEPTTEAQGYGLEIVVEGTGQYQYSTQIGIGKAEGAPDVSSQSSAPVATTSCDNTTMITKAHTKTHSAAPHVTGATGTQNVTSPVLTGTVPLSVPSNMPAGSASAPPAVGTTGAAATTGSSSAKPGVSSAFGVAVSAPMTGVLAAAFAALGYFL